MCRNRYLLPTKRTFIHVLSPSTTTLQKTMPSDHPSHQSRPHGSNVETPPPDADTTTTTTTTIRCHYDVLGVSRDADATTIKKAHRKLALKFHPDKNVGNASADDAFRSVQEAYECLSDPSERKWYDDHRDAILKGWEAGQQSSSDPSSTEGYDPLREVAPLMHPRCYRGFDNTPDARGFYQVYQRAFADIAAQEATKPYPDFGDADSAWDTGVGPFYRAWESFASDQPTFAWVDVYDTREAAVAAESVAGATPRQIRRAMDDVNTKERRNARKSRGADVRALVSFVKRRDPRVVKQRQIVAERAEEEARRKEQERMAKKAAAQDARDEWKRRAAEVDDEQLELDRLAGRVRLADLDDDYDYGGGRKNKKKGKKGKRGRQQQWDSSSSENEDGEDGGDAHDSAEGDGTTVDNAEVREDAKEDAKLENPTSDRHLDSQPLATSTSTSPGDNDGTESEIDEDEDDEQIVWRCECCRKDFKSQGQMENHFQSKKHKQAFQKYQAKLAQQ